MNRKTRLKAKALHDSQLARLDSAVATLVKHGLLTVTPGQEAGEDIIAPTAKLNELTAKGVSVSDYIRAQYLN
jgi:hypothetical protein